MASGHPAEQEAGPDELRWVASRPEPENLVANQPFTNADRARIVTMYRDEKRSIGDIRRAMHCGEQRVRDVLSEENVTLRSPGKVGGRRTCCKSIHGMDHLPNCGG